MTEYKFHTTDCKPKELQDDDLVECIFSEERKCTGLAKYFMWASSDECYRPVKYAIK